MISMSESDTDLKVLAKSRLSQSAPNSILANTPPTLWPQSPQAREPCACQLLHALCNPDLCDEALNTRILGADSSLSPEMPVKIRLSELRARAAIGCMTCAIIYDGLYLPQVLTDWDRENGSGTWSINSATVFLINRSGLFFASYHKVPQFDNLYAGLFDFTPDEDPDYPSTCRAFGAPRDICRSTASDMSFRALERWILDCKTHPNCIDLKFPILPSRVIDISQNPGKELQLRLYESKNEKGQYVTLSHCWGQQKFLTTTEETLPLRRKGIEWDSMPRTFQDAVAITHRLGFQYLWIDALCIVQDSPIDWQTESAKMGSIYQDSVLTIAASGARDGREGCFSEIAEHEAPVSHMIPSRGVDSKPSGISIRHGRRHFGTFIDPPLFQRAWAFQERVLSARIVHYTTSELVWECPRIIQCQCEGVEFNMTNIKLLVSYIKTGGLKPVGSSYIWSLIVEDYSSRDLTFETDRLPALSGLAKLFEHCGLGTYLAGLWSNDLPFLMLWAASSSRGKKYSNYIAPTWSWASFLGGVHYPWGRDINGESQHRICIDISGAQCTPSTLDSTGKVSSGYVKLSGQTVQVTAMLDEEDKDEDFGRNCSLIHRKLNSTCNFYPDIDLSEQYPRGQRFTVDCILWSVCENADSNKAYFMVVRPSTKMHGAHERLGIRELDWKSEESSDDSDDMNCAPTGEEWFNGSTKRTFTIV